MADVLPPPAALRPLNYRVFVDKILSDTLNLESVFSVKEKSVAVVSFSSSLCASFRFKMPRLNLFTIYSVRSLYFHSHAVLLQVEYRHHLTTSRQGIFDPLAHNGNLEFIMDR